jgi:hypothetical protein
MAEAAYAVSALRRLSQSCCGSHAIRHMHATAAVTVNLATTSAQNTGGAGSDTLSNFENLIGSAFNDILTGSASANAINGGAGNDTIKGGAGADILTGGPGNDSFVFATLTDSPPRRQTPSPTFLTIDQAGEATPGTVGGIGAIFDLKGTTFSAAIVSKWSAQRFIIARRSLRYSARLYAARTAFCSW